MAKKPTEKELERKVRETEKASIGKETLVNALRESQERLQLAVDGADLGMWDWKVQTGEVHFSERWAEILGYSHNEIKPHVSAWEDLLHPEDVPSVMETLEANLEGRDPFYECEHRLRAKSGEWRWVLARGKVIERDEEGKPLRHAGTHMDINERMETQRKLKDALDELEQRVKERTEELTKVNEELKNDIISRKQIEEALRESEEKYRLLTELLPLAIFEIDDNGKVTFANKSALRSTGFTPEDIDVGISMLDVIAPQDHERALIMAQQVMQGRLTDGSEYLIQRKDSSTYPGFINTRPSQSSTKGVTGYIFDLTSVKEAEKALLESEEKLARSKKMESLGLLAGGVAHDLNNVLAGIVSYPELLLLDLPEDSKFRKPIQTIHDSGTRAVDIVQDLLTIARGVASPKEPLNLNDVIKEYETSPEFNKLGKFHPTVEVKTDLDKNLMNISGSPIHIRKVIMNLVSNATEAIEGSGNVAISTINRYVDRPIRGYEDLKIGEYAVLTISDDGSGILSDHLERIFEPFFTKKVLGKSGTGLGLAVVWNIIQDHEGYIDVSSDEKGTTFELYFPIVRDEVSVKELSMSIEDYKGGGESVLVVDDVEDQREITCEMLDTLGYRTKAVSSGEEAVAYLQERGVDIILLDMIMDPGINGRETYERIIKIHPKQKAIIVSGFAETDEVKKTQRLGAGKYIKKPLTLQEIGLAIREELKKS